MSGSSTNASPRDTWNELRQLDAVADLPLPWPVAGAVSLVEHASTRRYYRIVAEAPAAAQPSTLVLALYERDDAEAVGRFERAAGWCLEAGVPVPRIHGSTSRALLVEDGGDALLADRGEADGLLWCYEQAVDAILALQLYGLGVDGPNPAWRLDAVRLRSELEHTEEHAVRGWLEAAPSPARSRAFDRLAEVVAQQPARICHRDFHSRNILVGDDKLMIVDFQDAMSGPLFYDLVSLLCDDYRDVPGNVAAAAVGAFARRVEADLPVSSAAATPREPESLSPGGRQGLALTAAQRSLKALGTFGYQVNVAGRHDYAPIARRTWGHARRALVDLGWDDLVAELAVFERL